MFLTLASLDGLLAVATLLPWWRRAHFLVRGCDFPRLQIAILLGVSIVVQLSAGWWHTPPEWTVLAAAVGCLLVQAWWIFPYLRIARCEVAGSRRAQPARSIRILTANVLQTNRQADAFLALVRESNPDLVVVLEANSWWQEKLDTLETEGFNHTLKHPLDNLYGMLLYSRFPLHGASTEFLVSREIPSMHALVELRSEEVVQLHVLHPPPPSPTENKTSSERDAELVMVGRSVRQARRPAIVTGDLNDVAWSATTRLFRKVSGMLDPRVGRGMFSSYHAKIPFLRWPLDHLFHSDHFCLNEVRRLPAFGSDHFPLLMDLQLDRTENGEGLVMDAEERAWAEEKVQAENVSATDVPLPT